MEYKLHLISGTTIIVDKEVFDNRKNSPQIAMYEVDGKKTSKQVFVAGKINSNQNKIYSVNGELVDVNGTPLTEVLRKNDYFISEILI